MGGNNRGGIIREGIALGGNCPWGEVTGGGNVRKGIVRGGNCSGVKCPRTDLVSFDVHIQIFCIMNVRSCRLREILSHQSENGEYNLISV